ncbi:uncharacterized protein LOC128221190 isoform X2 [Mya arenaria]|uniref:uncharacterized protein LOC128221190 isoform X2 n=1 Tax=Mya arenaria TaxID=6604 RepID=UPI0022E4DF5A|nr:uncharacterized protein LOC128221190 isoform X2 [Mya arenaria]
MATASFASVACCKEEENFTRMQMTIKKVCHKVLREYLVKKVYNIAPSVSIDHFLATNRTCLTRGRYGRLYEKRYFPLDANNQPIPTNLQDWDIQMLSFTLNNCCNLSQAETDDIDFIKDKRNYLCHLGKPEVADHLYTAFRSALVGTFKRMFSFLGNSKFEEEIKEDLETVDNRLPEHLVDFYKASHRENVETLEKFDIVQQELNNIRSEQSEHKQITETNTETLKKILDVLEEIYSVTPDNAKDKLELPEISVGKIIAKNCRNKQEEEKVTDAVVQSFSRNGLNDRIGNPLQRCIEKLKIMYGLVTSLGRGCIEFSIKFNTLQSSLCYIKDVVAGTLDSMLLPLQDALRQEVHNDSLELKVIMTDAQFAEYITTACIALNMPMYDSVAINTESHSRHSIHPSEISVVPSQRRSNEVTILSPYTGTPGGTLCKNRL